MRAPPDPGSRRACGLVPYTPGYGRKSMTPTMQRVSINGAELEVAVHGAGDAIVFIHGAGFADSYRSLTEAPALRNHYRTIRYRRRGFAGSSPVDSPMSVSAHASDCLALLDALGVA